MKIYIDIDETICKTPQSRDYSKAVPIEQNIEKFNKFYEQGHEITYWTARGTVSGIDFRELTEIQFKQWGVKYHYLLFGKPAFDLLIDDKALNSLVHLDCLDGLINDRLFYT